MRVFLTGRPGSGKSTLFMGVLGELMKKGKKIGGIATPEVREEGVRTGFLVRDMASEKEELFASIGSKSPTVGKYHVDIEAFERIAIGAMDFAIKKCDVVGLDEIGKMEMLSKRFKEKLREILDSGKPLIATVGRKFVSQFPRYGKVIEVTGDVRASDIVQFLI
jgi:nucleoside-triphosphatase